jgi:hypothetical protein
MERLNTCKKAQAVIKEMTILHILTLPWHKDNN